MTGKTAVDICLLVFTVTSATALGANSHKPEFPVAHVVALLAAIGGIAARYWGGP